MEKNKNADVGVIVRRRRRSRILLLREVMTLCGLHSQSYEEAHGDGDCDCGGNGDEFIVFDF
jgi:hypothetical protein